MQRLFWLRSLLIVAATAIIILLLPKADHQSYSYELNQPWKYALLTAEFDVPIMRDSSSANLLRDSINRTFVPFVKQNTQIQEAQTKKLQTLLNSNANPQQSALICQLVKKVYQRGVIGPELEKMVEGQISRQFRTSKEQENGSVIETIDASDILSEAKAFKLIDSTYNAMSGQNEHLTSDMAKAINLCLIPNFTLDTINDHKFRSQEFLSINAAMGVIKKGQRIVDRGEIVTPQIFTNLNTYLEMLDRTQENDTTHSFFLAGQALYILICFFLLYLFLSIYRPMFYANLKAMTFLVSYITLFVLLAILLFEYVPNGILFVPFAAVPIVVMVFFDARTALFSLLVTVMISVLVATFPFNFIFVESAAGLVATFSINQLSRRSQLLRTALLTLLTYIIASIAMYLVTEGNLDGVSWRLFGSYAINAVFLSFAYLLIFIIEKVFGFTSTVTLVELSDINNPLLRRLAEQAPGTFQHSMQVSTLATEAARAIGANTTLVRTGALYHDIGKMNSPVFFTENQHGVNPHAGLDPETSARKIISHVTGGIEMAHQEKLPAMIRDFIKEHHGRGITRYFYNTAVNNSKDNNVDITKFQYPGPNPQSRETAILMMADAIEAASRSLPEYSQEKINELVDKIIDSQLKEGLLNEAPISMRDIGIVKDTFKKRLSTIYHTRVAYPEIKNKSNIS